MAHDAPPAWPADAIEVGRIGEAWGLKGHFRVAAHSEPPTALLAARRWHLAPPEGPRPVGGGAALLPTLEVTGVRARGDGWVASSPTVTDRSAAEALRAARIFVARSEFPEPAADEFYWADLIGASVVNRAGTVLGEVAGLLDNGAQSILRVRPSADAAELLIPFVAVYVDAVDLPAHRIAVDWEPDY
ncbi:MAG: ribosome maturation factor RimM [Caldimonas sp.]